MIESLCRNRLCAFYDTPTYIKFVLIESFYVKSFVRNIVKHSSKHYFDVIFSWWRVHHMEKLLLFRSSSFFLCMKLTHAISLSESL